MRNITILFGAGAEQGFGISGGADFAINILGIKENEKTSKMNNAIKTYYSNKVKGSTWYPNHIEGSFSIEKLAEASIRKGLLEQSDSERAKTKKDFDEQVTEELEKLKDAAKKFDVTKCKDVIEKNTSYMGLLEEGFHTMISPKVLGSEKFWRVLNCYTRAYLLIAGQMRQDNKETKETYLEILNYPHTTYKEMVSFCKSKCNQESYYKIIKDTREKNDFQIKIITTNYTPLCKSISGIHEEDIAYIHGRFGLFEIPDQLKVFDIQNVDPPILNNEMAEDVYFPYVFIQSGIKPIVDEIQLREYGKMLKFLDESEVLFIVGYRMNVDDNHINSIIRSYILKNKRVVFFDFDNKGIAEILLKFKIKEHPNELFEYVSIDSDTCYKKFEETLNRYAFL